MNHQEHSEYYVCPFCGENIEDSAYFCPSCEIPHHYECWEENGGCTGFGCTEAPVVEALENAHSSHEASQTNNLNQNDLERSNFSQNSAVNNKLGVAGIVIGIISLIIALYAANKPQKSIVSNSGYSAESIDSEIQDIKEEVFDLKRQLTLTKLEKKFGEIAYLTPGSTGYSTVNFDLGTLTVSINNVTTYANGARVTLQFGNPLSSTINGLNLKIDYGEVNSTGGANNDTSRTKELTFTEALISGSWTNVDIVLEGFSPSRLGFVRVHSVSHTGIRLSK